MHNIISSIKSINAIGNKDVVEIQIDEKFFSENNNEINKKINTIKPSFEIKFVNRSLPKDIYEFNQDLISKVKNNTKEIIQQNKTEDLNTEKSYRRKIKKKIVDKQV